MDVKGKVRPNILAGGGRADWQTVEERNTSNAVKTLNMNWQKQNQTNPEISL